MRADFLNQARYTSLVTPFTHSYHETTDTAGKFPILGRFPNQHSSGTSADESILDVADVSLTYAANDWVSVFVHGIYTDLQFPTQEEAQIREAFITFGNLAESPWYLSVGRMTANFGNQGSYNPVTHSVNNHFFRIDSDDAAVELGYIGEDWRFAFHGSEWWSPAACGRQPQQ